MDDVVTDSLAGDLREHIYRQVLETPLAAHGAVYDKLSFHWVMSLEWFKECRKLADAAGRALWEPGQRISGPVYLLGMPVEIRDDGGVPHLEES
jgi:HK97 family phage major capsid protein